MEKIFLLSFIPDLLTYSVVSGEAEIKTDMLSPMHEIVWREGVEGLLAM